MITREQAEQAFNERYQHPQALLAPEIRHFQMKEINTNNVSLEDDTGPFEIEEQGWECTFQIRHRKLNLGEWTGKWDEWRRETCYIVEPKPGAYVVS